MKKVRMTFEVKNVAVELSAGIRKPLHDLAPDELRKLFSECHGVLHGPWIMDAAPVEVTVDGVPVEASS